MIKIGMLIADRYEVLEKIGTGGMSDVYKGKDHKLNRFVAIKVLKQEFYENANFVSKFRMEAQVSAGLMHPNIVNVYDVGEEKGLFYIVMELVDGITLKKYIEKKGRLSVREAVSIAIQVSMGLEAAHKAHVIHRDIKPQNIMSSKDGKVKVTDFGIAKAATSNTITSNVMGSVHYTSPEQARGGYSDEKSDIYSLGITLFEMLTGRVPFNGETTVAIAIKQIQQPMPSPREFVPDVPRSVEQIVLKCCEKSPDRRYQNMTELIDDLKESLLHPDDDFVQRVNPDTEGATRLASPLERDGMGRDYGEDSRGIRGEYDDGYGEDAEENLRLRPAERSREKDRRSDQSRRGDDSHMRLERDVRHRYSTDYQDDFDDEEERQTRGEHTATLIAVLAAIVIGAAVIFLAGRALGVWGGSSTSAESSTGTVVMINVVGEDEDKAKKELTDLGLDPQVTYEESSEKSGTVLTQDIDEGREVEKGTTVQLTVSASSSGIEVPDETGKSKAEARSVLEQKGFKVIAEEQSSESVESGYVVSQSPAGGENAPSGSTITIYVSTGKDTTGQVSVPTLTGITLEEAKSLIEDSGLSLGNVTEVYNDDANLTGKVCKQSVDPETMVDSGTKIDLEVSKGVSATYYYSGEIEAPTAEEDPNYVAGTPVQVTITGNDGTMISNSTVYDFPHPVAYTHLAASSATVQLAWYDTTPETTTTDDQGNTVTVPASQELKSVSRTITFTPED